jgi:poly(A) polymerase
MAVDVHHLQELIDPLGGAADLLAKRLRACSPSALRSDPVRILRAVRFSVNLELRIMNETLQLMREATPQLPSVSAERIRDELFRILASRHPGSSARIMDNLGVLEVILPEVCLLKEVAQSSPHIQDAWNHTLSLLDRLETLLDVLSVDYDPDKADNLSLGMVVMKLGRFRRQLEQHLANYINPDRSQRSLLFLAGFYHDAGKNASQSIENDGKIRFIGHEQIGSRIIRKRGKAMKLSGLEIERLATIVGHHMRPSLLSHEEGSLSKKAIYHYFRDTGPAGVDICLLSLADVLATYGPTLSPDRWSRHLDVVRLLLEAWWEDREERIFPAPLINGDELMAEFDLDPSPLVGYLLEAIREAQISHEVTNKEEAITLAERLVQESLNK